MDETHSTNQVAFRTRYLKLRKKAGFKDNFRVAEAYVKKYQIDTRHDVGWKEQTGRWSGGETKNKVYRALHINENSDFQLIDDEFDDKEEARGAAKSGSLHEIADDLLELMVVDFRKVQIDGGRGSGSLTRDENHTMNYEDETTLVDKIKIKLDEVEEIGSLPGKAYGELSEYFKEARKHRSRIIDDYVSSMNKQSFSIVDGNTATFATTDEVEDDRKEPKIVGGDRIIRSSTFDLSLCVAVIDFLEEHVSPLKATAAEVLDASHQWRMNHAGENNESRPALIGTDNEDWPIGAKEGDYLRETVENMIKHQFDIQPLFSPSKRCIGTLQLNSLAVEIGKYGYDRIGDLVDIKVLNDLELIGDAPVTIDAMLPLHSFGRYLGGGLDAILFEWIPDDNSRLIDLKDKMRLDHGIHIITSHDIIAYRINL